MTKVTRCPPLALTDLFCGGWSNAMGMYDPPHVGFWVDDRGNIAQFYEFPAGDIVATLDREATVNGVQDQLAWDGSGDVEAWAIANGYGDEIANAARV
jgi:hypothetical protein